MKFRRYRCAFCRGVWLVLAAFMARHLHRTWAYVEEATAAVEEETPAAVSADDVRGRRRAASGSRRRWSARLRSSARAVVQALVTAGVELKEAGEAGCRADLLLAMVREGHLSAGRAMAELAGWLHRLVPGLRLL